MRCVYVAWRMLLVLVLVLVLVLLPQKLGANRCGATNQCPPPLFAALVGDTASLVGPGCIVGLAIGCVPWPGLDSTRAALQ